MILCLGRRYLSAVEVRISAIAGKWQVKLHYISQTYIPTKKGSLSGDPFYLLIRFLFNELSNFFRSVHGEKLVFERSHFFLGQIF